MEIVLNVVVSE